ncbi:hypothetical protein HK104_005006, partial [Borealophlyctis nickersoniae]
ESSTDALRWLDEYVEGRRGRVQLIEKSGNEVDGGFVTGIVRIHQSLLSRSKDVSVELVEKGFTTAVPVPTAEDDTVVQRQLTAIAEAEKKAKAARVGVWAGTTGKEEKIGDSRRGFISRMGSWIRSKLRRN